MLMDLIFDKTFVRRIKVQSPCRSSDAMRPSNPSKARLMPLLLRPWMLMWLTALVGSCSRPASDMSFPSIVGGQPVAAGEFDQVVAIVSKSDDASHWSLRCSGTLISAQVILTAAHCLEDIPGVQRDQGRHHQQGSESGEASHGIPENAPPNSVPVTDGRTPLRLGVATGIGIDGGHFENVLNVSRVRIYPYFREHPLGTADVALVFLESPMPDVEPVRLPTTLSERIALQEQGLVTLVGYGRREDRSIGLKYKVDTTFKAYTALEAVAGGGGRDACDGDSGGPALAKTPDGQWWLPGVVARGKGFECGVGGILTITTQVGCWITQATTEDLRKNVFSPDSSSAASRATNGCAGDSPIYQVDEIRQIEFVPICLGASGSHRQQANARNMAQTLAGGDCQKAAELIEKERELDLSGAMVDDLSPLASARELRTLRVRGNFLTHLRPLEVLPQLALVDVTGNFIQDAGTLADLRRQKFRVLGLRRQVGLYADTAFLAACQSQETSSSARRLIQAIMWKTLSEDCVTANQRLLATKVLSLKDRDIKDLSPLFGLEHLTSLNLSGNPIEDVSPLAASESLRYLDLTGTAVEDLTPLDGLVSDGLSIRRL